MKRLILAACSLVTIAALASDIYIYPISISVASGGTDASCPFKYTATVNYRKTISQGWGWKPDTNTTTVFTATDTNQCCTHVLIQGKNGDLNCNQTTTQVPNPPSSGFYRFTVYLHSSNSIPANTNLYPLKLTGFLP